MRGRDIISSIGGYMAWNQEFSQGYESRKCRYRIIKYLKGVVFDLGCGNEKIWTGAIGIDISGKSASFHIDLSDPSALNIFSEGCADVVFSSHLLEDFFNTEAQLKAWWRLVKPNGHMILYLPHKDFYPNIGQPGSNPNHKKDFSPVDILTIMHRFASFNVVSNNSYNGKDEYSFELILQKKPQALKNFFAKIESIFPKKKAIVIRYGGMGDMIMITPVLKMLKLHGYHVTVNTVPANVCALDNNPNIDEILLQSEDMFPIGQVKDYVAYLETKYDRVINLCGSIEDKFLKNPRRYENYYEMFKNTGKEKLDGINYYDETLKQSGFKETGLNGEIFLSKSEQESCDWFKKNNEHYFTIMYCLKGSSSHKFCTLSEDIIEHILDAHKDIKVYIAGGKDVQPIGWERERLVNKIGVWSHRTSIIMPSVMDLVISPETGVLNAAGCFSTPKIGLLTHSSKNNLTKYFENDYSVQSKAECSPCHKLVHDINFCQMAKEYNVPICADSFDKDEIIRNIEVAYGNRRKDNTK